MAIDPRPLCPEDHSVNDGINPEWCSLTYVTVDAATRAISRSGRGTVLAKVDIKSAYRIVEVHPEDRWLLGFQWDGALFVDTVLPFGLRSAPKLFTALVDAMEWIVRHTVVETVFHYIDDFLLLGAPHSPPCDWWTWSGSSRHLAGCASPWPPRSVRAQPPASPF